MIALIIWPSTSKINVGTHAIFSRMNINLTINFGIETIDEITFFSSVMRLNFLHIIYWNPTWKVQNKGGKLLVENCPVDCRIKRIWILRTVVFRSAELNIKCHYCFYLMQFDSFSKDFHSYNLSQFSYQSYNFLSRKVVFQKWNHSECRSLKFKKCYLKWSLFSVPPSMSEFGLSTIKFRFSRLMSISLGLSCENSCNLMQTYVKFCYSCQVNFQWYFILY